MAVPVTVVSVPTISASIENPIPAPSPLFVKNPAAFPLPLKFPLLVLISTVEKFPLKPPFEEMGKPVAEPFHS